MMTEKQKEELRSLLLKYLDGHRDRESMAEAYIDHAKSLQKELVDDYIGILKWNYTKWQQNSGIIRRN